MTRLRPVCDRHTNLQMIPCSLRTTTGQRGYICPVPNCGRHRGDTEYFDIVETKPLLKDSTQRNRLDTARAAIMKVLEERLRPQKQILPFKQK